MGENAKSERAIVIGGASGFWATRRSPFRSCCRSRTSAIWSSTTWPRRPWRSQRARLRTPELGYATDRERCAQAQPARVEAARRDWCPTPAASIPRHAAMLSWRWPASKVDLTVATVSGDDVLALQERFLPWPGSDAPATPPRLMSANAYLGALPIARALAGGADIVVTGRCVDSAALLGIAIHEFGWSMQTMTASRRRARRPPRWSAAPVPRADWPRTGSVCPIERHRIPAGA